MRPSRTFAYAVTAALRAAGASVAAAEEEIPAEDRIGATDNRFREFADEFYGVRRRNALRNGWQTQPRYCG